MTSIRPSMMRLAGKKHHLVAVRRNIRLTYSSYLLPLKSGWKCFSLVFTAPPLTFTVHFHFSLFFVIIHHHLSITYISHQVNLLV